MCGISGFTTFNKVKFDKKKKLIDITNIIKHRGPDDSGYWLDYNNDIYLGHRRLSILDLSKRGNQPMISNNQRYIISFNGEIYNYKSIRKNLESKLDIKFKNNTDTTVLLELISLYGVEKSLKLIEGMFAFALFDQKDKSIYLARDLYGEKPLFYYLDDNFFVFGSELKVIKKFFHPNKLSIDFNSAELFSGLGYVPASKTIFKKTYKVMPAEILKFSKNKLVSKKKIQNLQSFKKDFDLDESSTLHKVANLVENSVKKMMIADVEIGCFLSGGVDSSLIAALMQKNSRRKIKTFSVGFREKSFDESQYSKKIANYLGTEHHEIIVSINDLIKNIENINNIYDEPFGDSSCLPTELISRYASQHVKVVLSGDGGDEVFMGYNRYLFSERIKKIQKYSPLFLRMLFKFLINVIPIGFYDNLNSRLQKKYGLQAISHKIQKISNLISFIN